MLKPLIKRQWLEREHKSNLLTYIKDGHVFAKQAITISTAL